MLQVAEMLGVRLGLSDAVCQLQHAKVKVVVANHSYIHMAHFKGLQHLLALSKSTDSARAKQVPRKYCQVFHTVIFRFSMELLHRCHEPSCAADPSCWLNVIYVIEVNNAEFFSLLH
jgi:hypothetical protein